MAEKKESKFSVGLGLLDYINPVTYLIINIIIAKNVKDILPVPAFYIYIIGVTVSLIFGFTIPTVKVLVGLGKFEFKMPVNLVFYVNSGIFVSGSVLFFYLMKPTPVAMACIIAAILLLLFLAYKKSGKFNTAAVLTGSAGYILIYISMISRALALGITAPVIFYGIAICLMIALVCIGCFANLYNAKVHWWIESMNVTCQCCVLAATFLLFCR